MEVKGCNCERGISLRDQRKVSDTCPNGTVEDLWYSLKDSLLKASDKVCGCTSKPPRHHITWWWNDDVEKTIKEKRRLWKAWHNDGGCEVEFHEAKRKAKKAVHAAKKKTEQERFRDVLRQEDDRAEVFKIAKQMTTRNHDVIGEKCVRNNEES